MTHKRLGRNPGDACNACGNGRLAAVFKDAHVCNPRAGGPPRPGPFLDHLTCTGCGLVYESAVKGAFGTLLKEQLKDFKSPDVEPTTCPSCGEGAERRHLPDAYSRHREDGRDILCCERCVRLLWSFPNRRDAALLRQLSSDETKTPR